MLTIVGSSLDGNSGGGISTTSGTATLDDCSLTNNEATDGAGVENSGTITLTNCTLANNHAFFGGGALYNGFGIAIISGCT